jgi:conjugal transfer pilus assembly protein TraF
MIRRIFILNFLIILLVPQTQAQEFKLPFCESSKMGGWSFYCREPEPEPEEEPIKPEPTPPEPIKPTEEETHPATKEIMEFRAMVDEIKYKAVLDPTPENIESYMRVNKLIADKAGDFTEQWQRVLFKTPDLDANNEYPLAQAGIGVYQDQLRIAREATLRKVANTSGLLFIFEDSNNCGVCRVQGEVLAQLKTIYDIEILAISKDGSANEHFENYVIDTGRLEELGLEDYPAPTLALINPKSNEVQVIGSGLLTGDTIMERVYVITEIPVGERY